MLINRCHLTRIFEALNNFKHLNEQNETIDENLPEIKYIFLEWCHNNAINDENVMKISKRRIFNLFENDDYIKQIIIRTFAYTTCVLVTRFEAKLLTP